MQIKKYDLGALNTKKKDIYNQSKIELITVISSW